MLSEKIRSMVGRVRSASAPSEPQIERVVFDPNDGKKRVLITVDTAGQFEPVLFFGTGDGIAEAANIAAHGALILTEHLWRDAAMARMAAATNGE